MLDISRLRQREVKVDLSRTPNSAAQSCGQTCAQTTIVATNSTSPASAGAASRTVPNNEASHQCEGTCTSANIRTQVSIVTICSD
jgi:hypothetical protein